MPGKIPMIADGSLQQSEQFSSTETKIASLAYRLSCGPHALHSYRWASGKVFKGRSHLPTIISAWPPKIETYHLLITPLCDLLPMPMYASKEKNVLLAVQLPTPFSKCGRQRS